MWSSLVLAAAAIGPAQPAGTLQLSNVRITVGEFGPTRPDSKLLPGDILFVGYDIDGLSIDGDGTAKYTIAMTVLDGAGKPFFKQDPQAFDWPIPLRGNKVPARAFVTIGLDTEPGNYTCQVTATDTKTKATNSLSIKFEVLKRDFGIVAVFTSYDAGGVLPAPPGGVVGQSVYIWSSIPSFRRDDKTKQPNVLIEYQILDQKGTPILEKPRQFIQDEKAANPVPADKGAFPVFFPLFLNRPGKFTVRITATDRIANKKATHDVPITVLPANWGG